MVKGWFGFLRGCGDRGGKEERIGLRNWLLVMCKEKNGSGGWDLAG